MALAFVDNSLTILDLDNLNASSLVDNANGTYDTTEIFIDCINKDFYFKGAGNLALAGSGVTGQALYSFFKFIWKNTASITKYDFPMLSITNEQFEFINGWTIDDVTAVTQNVTIVGSGDIDFNNVGGAGTDTITHTGTYDFRQFEVGDTIAVTGTASNNLTYTVTASSKFSLTVSEDITVEELNQTATLIETFATTTRDMIRTAAWAEQDVSGAFNKIDYAGIVSLGSFVDVVDSAYYAQDSAVNATTISTKYTGPVNEKARIYARVIADTTANGGNNASDLDFAVDGSITSTTSDLSVFRVGDPIKITGSATNDDTTGTIRVTAVNSATDIDTDATFSLESSQPATITADLTGYFKIFLRERGKIYSDSDLTAIGVTAMTYIVYRFPLSNSTDLNINTTADTDIDADGSVPASVSPYDTIQVDYLVNPDAGQTGPVNIVGPWESGVTYALGDVVKDATNSFGTSNSAALNDATTGQWYYVDATTGPSTGANMAADTGNTWALWTSSAVDDGEREVSGIFYAFDTILDAENTHANVGTPYTFSGGASKEQAYEWAQWALRRSDDIDNNGAGTRFGEIADLLVEFIGSVLHTKPGVFIDSFKETDANNVVFHDYADAIASYPLTVTVNINFNSNLVNDTDAVFRAYYTDLAGANDFGQTTAVEVNKADNTKVGIDVSNDVSTAGATYSFSYAYDEDTAGGNRSISTPTDITVVAIGLNTGQYVKAEGTIDGSGATISLVAPLERNYSNP